MVKNSKNENHYIILSDDKSSSDHESEGNKFTQEDFIGEGLNRSYYNEMSLRESMDSNTDSDPEIFVIGKGKSENDWKVSKMKSLANFKGFYKILEPLSPEMKREKVHSIICSDDVRISVKSLLSQNNDEDLLAEKGVYEKFLQTNDPSVLLDPDISEKFEVLEQKILEIFKEAEKPVLKEGGRVKEGQTTFRREFNALKELDIKGFDTKKALNDALDKSLENLEKKGLVKVWNFADDIEDKKIYYDFIIENYFPESSAKNFVADFQWLNRVYKSASSPSATQASTIIANVSSMQTSGGQGGIGSDQPQSSESAELEEMIYTCREFPNLKGIYAYYDECYDFFIEHNVIIPKKLLRRLLMGIEKDMPIILYGEPGDGKSLIIKTLLRWIAYHYNGGADPLINKPPTQPINPNLRHTPEKGVSYEAKNIDESTSPLVLYGGYSPETIGGGAASKKLRRQTIEWGIISRAIRDGFYLFFDELNRTENEVLARLMGFLQEPYSYKVEEANLKFVFKSPTSTDKSLHRSNLVILSTMNVGDVGNFKMSFAFKRRFEIINVHYNTDQIIEIVQKARGFKDTDKQLLKDTLKSVSAFNVSNNEINNFTDNINQYVEDLTRTLYEVTHEWVDQNDLTQFGVGVAHIFEVLKASSLYVQDLFLSEYIKDSSQTSNKSFPAIINSIGFKDSLKQYIEEVIRSNVIMALIDENDKYKMQTMEQFVMNLIDSIYHLVYNLLSNYASLLGNSYQIDFDKEFSLKLIQVVFKWASLPLDAANK